MSHKAEELMEEAFVINSQVCKTKMPTMRLIVVLLMNGKIFEIPTPLFSFA